jgi:hypothetical protein
MNPNQGPHLLVKMKFKDFSRTFKDLFQYIQGPGNWKNLWKSSNFYP